MPHLSLLGMEAAVLQQWQESLDRPSQDYASYKLTKKTNKKVGQSTLDMMSWRNAWDEYVRGNVVSDAAAKIIRRFLLNTMAASSAKNAGSAQSEADASESDDELPPLKLCGITFQELIKSAKDDGSLGEQCIASAKARAGPSHSGPAKKKDRLNEYEQRHRIRERVWKTDSSSIEAGERASPGNMNEESYQDHLTALKLQGKKRRCTNRSFRREARCCGFS